MNTKIIPLGGLGEVGKNMYVVTHNDEIIIVDAGVMFPDDELLGIDYVIPDVTFLKENESKIKALVITHGHEDHIGGIPFLLQMVNIPKIYAPNNAKELIEKKLVERNIVYKNLFVYDENTVIKTKYFNIEFFRTTHSIPDSHGLAIDTPDGTIVMTGDFKFDMTPIGPMSNLHKMARIGEKGVAVLMSDSTNALSPGASLSESVVDENLGEIFTANKNNRIILATFASNVYRIKHIMETCRKNNRKIALFGRSMENNINISIEGGYIDAKDVIVTADVANNLKPGEVVLLCTGTQGEPLAALSRIADGIHKQITLRPDDVVIFSSSAIPGNANAIARTINNLYLKGVKVYTTSNEREIHASGHAMSDELKLMIRLINPKYLMPIHGEYRMLKKHAKWGIECDIPKENTFILDNGDVLELDNGTVSHVGKFDVNESYVDGSRIGEISGAVLNDRKIMANDGILVIIANINIENRKLLGKPMITTRGFILINENEELINKIEKVATKSIIKELKNKTATYQDIKQELTKDVSTFIKTETGRKPIVLPIISNIKIEK